QPARPRCRWPPPAAGRGERGGDGADPLLPRAPEAARAFAGLGGGERRASREEDAMRGAAFESRAVDPGTVVTHAWRRDEGPLPRAPQPHALVVPGAKPAGLPPPGDSPPNTSPEAS